MRMARVNVYLPDDLAEEARAAGLNVSGLTQDAVRRALAAGRATQWLDDLKNLEPTPITHQQVLEAVAEAKDELGSLG